MKILYVTFFEPIISNGIYDSQVKHVLCTLAARNKDTLQVSHVAFLPAILVGRRSLDAAIVSNRNALTRLKEEYGQHGVRAHFYHLPVALPRRWTFHFQPPLLGLLWILAFPVLLWRATRMGCDVIHCRSYVATLLALSVKTILGRVRVVFDPRGFYPEEGVVHGRWKNASRTFLFWKWLERKLVSRSDTVIALSQAFSERIRQIFPQVDCSLIYAGTDLQHFRPDSASRESMRLELGLSGSIVFAYNGGLGSWHDPVLLAQLFSAIRQGIPRSKLLVLTGYNRERLTDIFSKTGLLERDFQILSVEPTKVSAYLTAANFGIVPLRRITQASALQVVADTMVGLKVAEYLASGLPLIVNNTVKGIQPLMNIRPIGIFFDPDNLSDVVPGIHVIMENYRQYHKHCRLVAARCLSLDRAAQSYLDVYENIHGRRTRMVAHTL